MSDSGFRYNFSKILIESAISAMRSMDSEPKESDKIKIIDLFYLISESMTIALEEFLKIEDPQSRESYITKLEERLSSVSNVETSETSENSKRTLRYSGKETPEA